ncbi:MAG: NB-ARC domain-containing protein, partial [Xenococcus sp. (in: cyanobacteria)]
MRILILEANRQRNLKLNEEIRDLQNIIERPQSDRKFEIKISLALRSSDLQEAILRFEPNIIHFCGHGTGKGGLVLIDKKLNADILSDLFALFKEHLECVVLNACYSEVQADAINKHIKYVIGMNQAIRDDAAIAFSIGFYRALSYGKSYTDAFKFGCNAIQLQIAGESIDSQSIEEETRKLVPLDVIPEITITEEHKKPILKINNRNLSVVKRQNTLADKILHNLPSRDYKNFIGREEELKELLTQVCQQYRQFINIVHGIGGVGKTALAVEVAYLHLLGIVREICPDIETEEFEAIIFISAKQTYLTPSGIIVRSISQQTLQEIFIIIAEVLEQPNIVRASKEEQFPLIYKILKEQKTLLIIDNMETITDTEELKEIFSFLADLPTSTQAILTTRLRDGSFNQIELKQLSQRESLDLIQQEANKKGIEIPTEEAEEFYKFFGGIPVALIYAVGQRAMDYSTDKIFGTLDPSLPNLQEDLAEFIFENSIAPLRGQPAHKLLMAMTLFITSPTREALSSVAGLADKLLKQEDGFVKLQKLSLLTKEKNRYKILPITRRFALDEISKYPNFTEQAQNRLIEFYLKFTERYGGKDWKDWRINYDYLAQEWENIQFVLSLCASLDKYEEVKQLWRNIDHFADLSSFWLVRLNWWEWLKSESDRRADLPTYVKAISEKAWTLILMKNPENREQARKYLEEAWKKKDFVGLDTRAHIANHFAVYEKTEEEYEDAFQWLNIQEVLVDQSDLSDKEKKRHKACIRYYRGEI